MVRQLAARFASVAAVALASGAALAQAPGSGDDWGSLSPVTVLLRMKKAYATCRSYRDTGTVKTVGAIEGGSFASEVPFATAFARSGAFRFQFEDRGLGDRAAAYIVWSEGDEVRSWWDAKPGVRRPASLQEALDAAAGITNDASIRVPGMLLPATVGAGAPLIDPERVDDEVDRGVACICIRGQSRATPYVVSSGSVTATVRDETTTLWLDRASLLIRRIEQRRTLDTYTTTITTTYSPELNVDVPLADLAFNPPASASPTPAPSAPAAAPPR